MRITIRRGVFETNSSSSHSLSILHHDDFEKWRNGDDGILLDYENDRLISREDAIENAKELLSAQPYYQKVVWDPKDEEYNQRKIADILRDCDYYTYNQFECRNSEGEEFEYEFTTRSGDKIVVFGCYGNY